MSAGMKKLAIATALATVAVLVVGPRFGVTIG